MKRIITLLIILVVIAILAAAGWYLFARDADTPLGEVIRDVLPFGSGDDVEVSDNLRDGSPDITNEVPVDEYSSPTADIFRISNTPVAGSVVFERGNQLVVRYADRATGHIYDAVLPTTASSTQLQKTRITNNTLPKIYEAYFAQNGATVLFRSLKDDTDTVENLSIAITPPTAKATSTEFYTMSSTLLRGNIGSVAVGTGNNLFYSLEDTSSIVSSAFAGTGLKTLLTSPYTNWRLASAGNNLIVHTKASSNIAGFAYTLNTTSGGLNKILGPLNGLVAIPNSSGNKVAYSHMDDGRMRLSIKNLQNGQVSETSIETIAEKCVWGTKSATTIFCGTPVDWNPDVEPNNWYRGLTHFSDRIWAYDTSDDNAYVLAEPESSLGIKVDAIDLKLSPDEDYLVFINKTDLSLWALKLD